MIFHFVDALPGRCMTRGRSTAMGFSLGGFTGSAPAASQKDTLGKRLRLNIEENFHYA